MEDLRKYKVFGVIPLPMAITIGAIVVLLGILIISHYGFGN